MMFNTPLVAFPGFTRDCVLSNHRKPSRGALAQGHIVAIRAVVERMSSSLTASYIRHRRHRRRGRRHRFASFGTRITPI